MEETKEYYAIAHKNTGRLLHLDISYNGDDRYACGSHTYRLVDQETNDGIYKVESLESAIKTLATDSHWFNSSEEHPCWSYADEQSDYKIVKLTETIIIEDVNYTIPIILSDNGLVNTVSLSAKKKLTASVMDGSCDRNLFVPGGHVFRGGEMNEIIDVIDLSSNFTLEDYGQEYPNGFAIVTSYS